MKALYCRKTPRILRIVLIFLLLISFTECLSQISNDTFDKNITQLNFKPLNKNSKTQYCCDKEGNTWLRITIPNNLLCKPLILQFLSVHVEQYYIYVKKKDSWIKVLPNKDLEGGTIKSQFQENHFNTSHPIIYFKSTLPYIYNGKYTLKERGDYRAFNISNILKLGLFYSLSLMSIIINLGLYFLFKGRVVLIYCVFLVSILSICLLEDGFLYFLSDGMYNKSYFLTILVPTSSLLFSLFMYTFLDARLLSKRIKYLYIGLIILFLILGSLYFNTENKQYLILLISGSIGTALITIALTLLYYKRDLSTNLISFTFSIVALFAIGYYLSIYLGNGFLSFIDMPKMKIILGTSFVISSYAILIKVKKLKAEHEELKTEFEHLKANQAKTIYEDLIRKETTNTPQEKSSQTVILQEPIIIQAENYKNITTQEVLREKYCCTDREVDVIIEIWNGLTNQEIAEKLSISLSTTKQHVSNAYLKLEVKNRSQAMILKGTLLDK